MSSHCYRYPHCGCGSSYGTKCHLPNDAVPLGKEAYSNDPESVENIEEGIRKKEELKAAFDVEAWKQSEQDKYARIERGGKSRAPHRKYPTNYTKPKRRKKK